MAKASKPKKKRASKYDEKLAINGNFEDVIKISTKYTPQKKKKAVKEKKK